MVYQEIPADARFQDLTGKTFGKLTVAGYAGKKSGKYSLWHCLCDCGGERTLVSSVLTLGRSTNACKRCVGANPKLGVTRRPIDDLSGKTFGRLTVESFSHRNKELNRTYWNCKCSCGESRAIRADAMIRGFTLSCGCLNIARNWIDQPVPPDAECRKCRRTFPLTTEHFYRHPAAKFGFRMICKPCVRVFSNAISRRNAGKIRMEILTHYCGGIPHCQCVNCPETHLEFLTVDHIEGGGKKHRAEIGGNLYAWMKKNGYPSGFRILCMNCNHALGHYARCPHDPS